MTAKTASGNIKFLITAIDNDGVKKTLTSKDWSEITGECPCVIRQRYKREVRYIAEGLKARNMRQIVGLDEYIALNGRKVPEKKKRGTAFGAFVYRPMREQTQQLVGEYCE